MPSLDSSGEPWVGHFPGLGTVRVAADGTVDVAVAPDAPDAERAAAALAHGWGEPLSHLRRGRVLLNATAVLGPDRAGAVLLTGSVADVELLWLALAKRGWGVLSERFVACSPADDGLLVHRRSADPVGQAARVRRVGITSTALRPETDAVVAQLGRPAGPEWPTAVVRVALARPGTAKLTPVLGPARLRAVGLLLAGSDAGVPADGRWDDRAALSRLSAALTALPQAELDIGNDRVPDAIAALRAWLVEPAASPRSAEPGP